MSFGRIPKPCDQVLDSRPKVEGYTAEIGDVQNGNYFEVQSDGTIKFHGEGTVWDD